MQSDSKQQVALITGGSSGIGLALARQLASKRYNLLLVSNQQNALEICKSEIETAFPVSCFILYCDLSTSDSAKQVFEFANSQSLEVEILINNAGMMIFNETAEVPPNDVAAMLQLHVHTPTLLCSLFGKEMKQRKKGMIMNVSSISAVMPYPGISLYGPTKTYLRYFTRALRNEMKIYGISVSCLIPGATETGLFSLKQSKLRWLRIFGIVHKPEFVAAKAINALMRNRAECIPGFINKMTVCFLPMIPPKLIYFIHKNTSILPKGDLS